MAVTDANRARIERLTARLAARRSAAAGEDARAAFEAAFVACREEILTPLLRELGAELAKAGHAFSVDADAGPRRPSVYFRVSLAGGQRGNANTIGFFVNHAAEPDGASDVTAFLELKGEFELGRFQSVGEMRRDALEQMLVDGLEHMLVCNA